MLDDLLSLTAVVCGVVLILEGMPWFLSPRGTKRLLSEVFLIGDTALRVIGLVSMLVGLFVVYLSR
jgi:uncharacterized protein YjeT (DUF2065 family)